MSVHVVNWPVMTKLLKARIKDPVFLRACFIDVLMNVGLGVLIGVVFTNIGLQVFFNTDTTGWDATTIIIWNSWPWAIVGGDIIATIRYVQNPSSY